MKKQQNDHSWRQHKAVALQVIDDYTSNGRSPESLPEVSSEELNAMTDTLLGVALPNSEALNDTNMYMLSGEGENSWNDEVRQRLSTHKIDLTDLRYLVAWQLHTLISKVSESVAGELVELVRRAERCMCFLTSKQLIHFYKTEAQRSNALKSRGRGKITDPENSQRIKKYAWLVVNNYLRNYIDNNGSHYYKLDDDSNQQTIRDHFWDTLAALFVSKSETHKSISKSSLQDALKIEREGESKFIFEEALNTAWKKSFRNPNSVAG